MTRRPFSAPPRSRVTRSALALLIALGVGSGCSRGEAASVAHDPAVEITVPHARTAAPYGKTIPKESPAAPPNDGREPGDLAMVVADTVIGRTGPGGEPFEVALRSRGGRTHLTRSFGARTLELGARVGSAGLSQYPCSACHVDGRVTAEAARVPDAHRNIQPVHPHETGASCTGCHAPDNVELLALPGGERASLDHAYRLCAQCHAPQVGDWAAGAHGKRLDGWQGRRVVMGCADCHDPHRPALERRIPFRPPFIPRTGGRQR